MVRMSVVIGPAMVIPIYWMDIATQVNLSLANLGKVTVTTDVIHAES